jgi:hypothetical protein
VRNRIFRNRLSLDFMNKFSRFNFNRAPALKNFKNVYVNKFFIVFKGTLGSNGFFSTFIDLYTSFLWDVVQLLKLTLFSILRDGLEKEEEFLRNLALIRNIRDNRLPAIKERLVSIEGMLETLVSVVH